MNQATQITFSEFQSQCVSRGYVASDKTPGKIHFAVKTKNKVEVEIKKTSRGVTYVTGFSGNKEKLGCLKDELESNGSVIVHQNQNYLFVQLSDDLMGGFWTLVAMIEGIDELVKQAVLRRAARFCEAKFDYDSVYLYSAKLIRLMLDNGRTRQLARGNGLFDEIDSMITLGCSEAAKILLNMGKTAYREHIVPCDLIISQAVAMIKAGSTDDEVALMIFKNLFIVIITPEEAAHLDYVLGLKTTMPAGWNFGDDIFARLVLAGIAVVNA